jgi:hypothetical protein
MVYHNATLNFIAYRSQIDTLKSQTKDMKSQSYELLKILEGLDKLPLSKKKKMLLFIPKDNVAYWGLHHSYDYYNCKAVPLIAPAISGIAMIDGLPPMDCETKYYGYNSYTSRKTEQTAKDRTNSSLCFKALGKGFHNIIKIDQTESGFQQTYIKCD